MLRLFRPGGRVHVFAKFVPLVLGIAIAATRCGVDAPTRGGMSWDAGPGVQTTVPDAGETADAGPRAPCPDDVICIDRLPFHDERDTTASTVRGFDRYSCAAPTNESGPEFVYRFTTTEAGIAGIRVTSRGGADIDAHLLRGLDANTCFGRDDVAFSRFIEPGTYFVVADTWVDRAGTVRAGPYRIDITWTSIPTVRCDMRTETIEHVSRGTLDLPATGPVVLEAHLVTTDEPFDGGWPSSGTDGLARHHALSEAVSGFVANRGEPWAPFGEGGSMFGQGSSIKPPPDREAWYVNMYWRRRPTVDTRMIVRQPDGGALAVVGAAGYETGPGSATAVGGATEEIHKFLGTAHRSTLTMGFAVDQSLPFGPVRCAP
ncbi:MAG: hypothetical protein HYY84_03905 [Deltaproteobacteria bacterium]|nr:hypothetical protein [Deltaproteobacteria bacterium]